MSTPPPPPPPPPEPQPPQRRAVSRRWLLGAGVAVAAGAGGVAYGDSQRGGSAAHESGSVLVPSAQVPPGGGVVLTGAHLVVTRDGEGQLHAFTSVCTHAGCDVSSVAGGVISCPCHGSQFDAASGSVVQGPANRPLAGIKVHEANGQVVLG